MNKVTATSGCIFAMLAIALGAFGAHALKDALSERGTTEVWKTAVDYHMWHALALLLCSVIPGRSRARLAAVYMMGAGILLFSGSLYWLALGGPKWLGPITPLGGLSLMASWGFLAASLWSASNDQPKAPIL